MPRKSVRALWAAKLAGQSTGRAPVAVPTVGAAFQGMVLGIDPSLRATGLAVVECGPQRSFRLIAHAQLKQPAERTLTQSLASIAAQIDAMLAAHAIDAVAVEETIYVQNFNTAQILGAARGAALATVGRQGLTVAEYPPLRIKQAVVGYGRASKEQVAKTVQALLKLPEALDFDASDAAAVALCHAFTHRG